MDKPDYEKEIFEIVPVPQALRVMIMPAVVSQIIVLIYNMADTFFLGKTNNPYMVAGTSLVLPVFNLVTAFASLTGVGGGTVISALLGKNEKPEAKRVCVFSFYLSILIALAFSLLLGLFTEPVLLFLGAGENTLGYAKQYMLCVVILGGIPTALSNVLSNLVRSVGMSKQAGFGITMGGLLNILLDPLFMFILLPRGQEVLGVGIATLLANCIACGYFFIVVWRMPKDSVITFHPNCGLPEKKSIRRVFIAGAPSGINGLLFDLDYMVLDKLMSGYSDIALAAVGIVLKVERLPLNIGTGICQGMIPLISYNHASGNGKRRDDVVKLSRKIGLIMSAISVALYECFAPAIIRFFILETETVQLATVFLRIRVLATPLMFMSFFTVFFFQGVGKGNIALFLSAVRWGVFNIPMLYILNALIGLHGIVWAQITADVLTVSLSVFVFQRYRPKQNIMAEIE